MRSALVVVSVLAACSTAHKVRHDAGATDDGMSIDDPDGGDLDGPIAPVDGSRTPDAGPTPDGSTTLFQACNALSQGSCSTGEKCTWIEDDNANPPNGHAACAPNGTVAIGGSCTYGSPGATTGFDNCVAGSVCIGGTCEAICDTAGVAPNCATGFGCVRYSGLFAPAGMSAPAGVCEPSCDPLADNDYDGAGTASTRTGTACGADVNVGCYGQPTSSGAPTHFICARPAAGTETRVHRQVLAANEQYLNACHPGYTLAFANDATGSTNVDCYAWCRPGNSYSGAATQEPNGKTGAQCKVGSSARQGNFGTAATATVNGEHCMYSWNFEVDASDVLHRSPTSDTLGVCWDHTKYQYDSNGDGTPDTAYPPCGTQSLANASAMACVDSATAGRPAAGRTVIHRDPRLAPPLIVPSLDPRFATSAFGLPAR